MIHIIYENICLREFKESDINDKIKWINNEENNTYLHYDIPLEYDKTLQWLKNKNNNRIDCIIEYNNIPVGLIGILNIDSLNLKAEFYISIGETQYKQKGIATKASLLLIDYTFNILNLHKLYLNTDAKNIIAHKLFEKIGFVREGYFVDDLISKGKFIDRVRYGLINSRQSSGVIEL